MNKAKLIRISKAIIFVLLLFGSIFSVFIIKQKVYDSYGVLGGYTKKYPLENIEYSFDGVNFTDYRFFESEEKYTKKRNMIVRGTINSEYVSNPVLYIATDSNFYEVFVNEVKLLEKEKISVVQVFNAVDFESLSEDANGAECEIFLYASNPEQIGDGLEIYVTNKFQVLADLIFGGFGSLTFSVFAFISGILLLSSTISARYRNYGLGIIGYISILMSLVWLFSYNKLTVLFIGNPYLVSFGATVAVFQLPIAMLLFSKKYERNKELKIKYQSAVNAYIVFLLGVLVLEALEIFRIQDFTIYISVVICFVYAICLMVFINILRTKEFTMSIEELLDIFKDKEANIDKNYDNDDYENAVFRRYIPFVFTTFVAINLIGTLWFIFTGNQNSYIIAIGISTIILILLCCLLFSYDLRKINIIAITDQEHRALNRNRSNVLVEEQANIFNESDIGSVCEKFSQTIKGILFPYGDIEKNDYTLVSHEVKAQYIADYKIFTEQVSSIVYVVVPDESGLQQNKHMIFVATGEFEKYLGLDPQKAMSKEDFGELLFIMKGIKEISKSDMAVKIGSDSSPKGLLLFKNVGKMDPMLKGLLESYVRTCAILIENLSLIHEAKNIQYDTVYNLNEISELRSKETGYHIKRVSLYSVLLGKKLGMSAEELEILQLASSMHDIGKISIPDKILNKPGKLTDVEFDIMKTHAELGHDILKNTSNKVMKIGAIVAKYHHEKVNGKGYFGLKNEEIPKVARIVAIADVFDALSVTRVYKDAWPLDKIIDLFKKERGQHFDEELVDILFENLGEFLEIRDRYKEEHI